QGGIWFHRGVSGDFKIPSSQEVQVYKQAEQIYSNWLDTHNMPANSPQLEKAREVLRNLGKQMKGQMFTSSVTDAAGFKGGTTVFSIQLPPNVYRQYLSPGSRMGAGQYLTIPGEDLL